MSGPYRTEGPKPFRPRPHRPEHKKSSGSASMGVLAIAWGIVALPWIAVGLVVVGLLSACDPDPAPTGKQVRVAFAVTGPTGGKVTISVPGRRFETELPWSDTMNVMPGESPLLAADLGEGQTITCVMQAQDRAATDTSAGHCQVKLKIE